MIRDLAKAACLIGLMIAVLYLAIERPAIEAELRGELCTNGRISWECTR